MVDGSLVTKSLNQIGFNAFGGSRRGAFRSEEMAEGDKYRARALELQAQAKTAKDGSTRAKFENLAAAFVRLAIQADKNADLVIDQGPPSADKEDKPQK